MEVFKYQIAILESIRQYFSFAKNKMNKTISVWLTLEDGINKGKFALQKRNTKNKRFFYICQATWAGKVEKGESIKEAVLREGIEELGKIFSQNFDFSKLKLLAKSRFLMDNSVWECSHYLGTANSNILKKAKIHKEAFTKFVFIDKNDQIYPDNSGKDPKNNIVLFDDQYKVIKKVVNKR
jgi:hypothetical protein